MRLNLDLEHRYRSILRMRQKLLRFIYDLHLTFIFKGHTVLPMAVRLRRFMWMVNGFQSVSLLSSGTIFMDSLSIILRAAKIILIMSKLHHTLFLNETTVSDVTKQFLVCIYAILKIRKLIP